MFFADRSRRGRDRFLHWKIAALAGGALFLLFAVRLDWAWLVWVAIAVVIAGFVVRFLPQKDQDRDEPLDR